MSGPSRYWPASGIQFIVGFAALGLSIFIFGFDVVTDVTEHIVDRVPYSAGQLIHLALELVGVVGLAVAGLQLKAYFDLTRQRARDAAQSLSMLRGDFQRVLEDRFVTWRLTVAEADVALMLIKGLSANDIARARNTAVGTVKAQTTAIFRKISVSSKAEMMAVIVEEFLDSGTAPKAR